MGNENFKYVKNINTPYKTYNRKYFLLRKFIFFKRCIIILFNLCLKTNNKIIIYPFRDGNLRPRERKKYDLQGQKTRYLTYF